MAAVAVTAAGGALLSIESLAVSIDGRPVLEGMSLDVAAGEIVGLVGASGSGKSLTALAIMQLLPPTARAAGQVRLDGLSLLGLPEARLRRLRGRDMSMVFQEPMTALNPLLSIGDQVAETVGLHRTVSRPDAWRMAQGALEAVGLRGDMDLAGRYPHELSGGQRQRAAIAMAVVLGPRLLIADEPTTALDALSAAGVLRLMRDLARDRRMGILLISHDLGVMARTADRVLILDRGRIIDRTTAPDSLRDLRHPYSRALLAVAAPAATRRGAVRAAAPAAAPSTAPELAPPTAASGARARAPATAPPAVPAPAPAVLEVRGVVVEYPRPRRALWHAVAPYRAVDGVWLEVRAGETVGLVGESGSGKSSLLRAVLALAAPREGEVRLLGERLAAGGPDLRRLRRSVQAVFQDPVGSFDPRWTVERLIAEPLHLLPAPPTAADRRRLVADALERVGLSATDARRLPHEFSGGQRQRIAIARALILEPALIVFDEAVSALDRLVRAQILELLESLSQRLRLAYLFVSHDLDLVRAIADRVYVMQGGRIVEQGITAEVMADPRHAYTRMLLAASPSLDPL